ncbi:hypothetical protein [Archangium sp.]|uniref:hypothetical protein n=1 Tax=Archangium sp. TaxID=1872627 RepID=UPI00389AE94D
MHHAVQSDSELWEQPLPEAPREERSRAEVLTRDVVGNARELFPPELVAEDEERTDPRAGVASLFDLSHEEWQRVCQAPLMSFLWVASADGRVYPGEKRALVRALEQGQRARSEVFRVVCGQLLRKRSTLMAELVCEPMLEAGLLPEVYRLLARKLGRKEAERFKWCLLELGRQVAEASGGLGALWGWLRREERHALAGLALELDSGRAQKV